MPLMTWDAEYGVQVNQFDQDHQRLFGMVNDLNDAMRAGKGKFVLGQVLRELVRYTQQHFAAEEAAMRKTRFPDMAAHAEEHQLLTKKVQTFLAEFEAGNALISIDVLHLLRDWLDNHIRVTDKSYAAHLNANGIS